MMSQVTETKKTRGPNTKKRITNQELAHFIKWLFKTEQQELRASDASVLKLTQKYKAETGVEMREDTAHKTLRNYHKMNDGKIVKKCGGYETSIV
jgi:hypothetical protein